MAANVFEPTWTDRDDPGLAGRTARVGAQAGAERLGATVYEIAPGSAGSPLHAHHANEELIIVLDGQPVLRTEIGHRRLAAGEVVACPVGRPGAHQLINDSDEPLRVLVVSTMVYPEVVEMLDSDKILAQSAPPGVADRIALAFPRAAQVDRLAGEPARDA
ncbi:MAG: cupin domain-containing protein [Solirubrobacteraceae bacterium]